MLVHQILQVGGERRCERRYELRYKLAYNVAVASVSQGLLFIMPQYFAILPRYRLAALSFVSLHLHVPDPLQ
jgi:hypothetical protein